MDFTFETKNLRELCENAEYAKNQLGETAARQVWSTLAELVAASDLNEFAVFSGKQPADSDGALEISHAEEIIMKIRQGHRIPPINSAGVLNLSEVKRVRIISLEKSDD